MEPDLLSPLTIPKKNYRDISAPSAAFLLVKLPSCSQWAGKWLVPLSRLITHAQIGAEIDHGKLLFFATR